MVPLVVWQPKQGGTERAVPSATATFPDRRAHHFWDERGWTLQNFKQPLQINVEAWDLYLLYGPDARWDGPVPPVPLFWMHQLWGVDNGPELDAAVFGKHVAQTLTTMAH